jgi:ribosomal protein S18 acetylase RimI-like enzyme
LFVLPEFRGRGIGEALLKRVAAVAVEKECGRLNWAVLDWNTPAIDFYRTMGAEFMDEWRLVRLEGDAIKRLAGIPPISAKNAEMDGAQGEQVGRNEVGS